MNDFTEDELHAAHMAVEAYTTALMHRGWHIVLTKDKPGDMAGYICPKDQKLGVWFEHETRAVDVWYNFSWMSLRKMAYQEIRDELAAHKKKL